MIGSIFMFISGWYANNFNEFGNSNYISCNMPWSNWMEFIETTSGFINCQKKDALLQHRSLE